MGSKPSSDTTLNNPWHSSRRRLLLSLLHAGGIAGAVALTIALLIEGTAGRDVLAGATIVWIPQVWFTIKGFGRASYSQPALLAVTKFGLSGVGFALWFAVMPTASAALTLAGALMALVLVPAVIFWRERQAAP